MIPRDLETIVLKAMAKEPSARYASASAMSEDLRRFLAGEAIRARRTGPVEQLWRWSRRNPLAASLAAAVAVMGLVVVVGTMISARREARCGSRPTWPADRPRSHWPTSEKPGPTRPPSAARSTPIA